MSLLILPHDKLVAIIRDHIQQAGYAVGDVTISAEPIGMDDFGHRFGPPYQISATADVVLPDLTGPGQSPA